MNDTIHIYGAEGLQRFGINPLTGEACAYGRRTLCDLNAEGVRLLRTYWGLSYDAQFVANWNSQVNGEPAVASVMLARSAMPDIAIFSLFHQEGFPMVLQNGPGLDLLAIPAYLMDKYVELLRERDPLTYTLHRNMSMRVNKALVHEGRNVHQATGRAL